VDGGFNEATKYEFLLEVEKANNVKKKLIKRKYLRLRQTFQTI